VSVKEKLLEGTPAYSQKLKSSSPGLLLPSLLLTAYGKT